MSSKLLRSRKVTTSTSTLSGTEQETDAKPSPSSTTSDDTSKRVKKRAKRRRKITPQSHSKDDKENEAEKNPSRKSEPNQELPSQDEAKQQLDRASTDSEIEFNHHSSGAPVKIFKPQENILNRTFDKKDETPPKKVNQTNTTNKSVHFVTTPNPANVKKRRGTYELNESVHDLSLLKSMSGENTPQPFKRTNSSNISTKGFLENRASLLRRSFSHGATPQKRVVIKRDLLLDDVSIPWEIERTPKEKTPLFGHFEKVFLNTPPSDSSTPFFKNKKTVAKGAGDDNCSKKRRSLEKNSNVSFKANKSLVKKSVRTKMPNFSKIHNMAFEQMEDIEQFTVRKAERAKLLLSGIKPTQGNTDELNHSKASKKRLQFPLNHTTTHSDDKPSTSQNGNTKLKPLKDEELELIKPKLIRSIKNVKPSRNLASPSKIPLKPATTLNPSAVNNNKIKSNDAAALSTVLSKKKISSSSKNVQQGVNSKFGFIGSRKTIEPGSSKQINGVPTNYKKKKNIKKDIIKAVINKSKIVDKKIVQKKREEIKGVRTNRRFELLMKMRNK